MKVETMIGALMLIIHMTVGQDEDSSKRVEGTRTLYEKAPEPSIGFEKYIDWINLSDSLTSLDRVFVQFYVDTSGQVIDSTF